MPRHVFNMKSAESLLSVLPLVIKTRYLKNKKIACNPLSAGGTDGQADRPKGRVLGPHVSNENNVPYVLIRMRFVNFQCTENQFVFVKFRSHEYKQLLPKRPVTEYRRIHVHERLFLWWHRNRIRIHNWKTKKILNLIEIIFFS